MKPKCLIIEPQISKDDVVYILSHKSSKFLKKNWRNRATLKRIELVYLPFFLFDMTQYGIQKGRVCVDGLIGHAFFSFKDELRTTEKQDVPLCPFVLSPSEGETRVQGWWQGITLEQGLRRKHPTPETSIGSHRKMYYPFWVGYFETKNAYDFRAVDAVTGDKQGVRMRKVFLRAFREMRA
jgi:hypothetical protein